MKKFQLLFFVFIAATLLVACSKTVDGLGVDAINNNAKIGKWEVTYQTYLGTDSEPLTNESITEGNGHAIFKDGKVNFYNESGVSNPDKATSYSFIDTKSINYGGEIYTIDESLTGSFSTMTLQRKTTTGREVYIFTRQ